jgi:hypothetical protein
MVNNAEPCPFAIASSHYAFDTELRLPVQVAVSAIQTLINFVHGQQQIKGSLRQLVLFPNWNFIAYLNL